jgi:hypothetical protein
MASVFIVPLVYVFRVREVGKKYYPFLLLILIGCLNDGGSLLKIVHGKGIYIVPNLFTLLEGLLVLRFLNNLGLKIRIKHFLFILYPFVITVWLIENFYIRGIDRAYNSHFSIVCSITIVLFSINVINKILVKERDVLRNADFLLCIAFVIYFTYRILVEVFWLLGESLSDNFLIKVYTIHSFVNILCNIIYAVAILWIQKRQAFTMQY